MTPARQASLLRMRNSLALALSLCGAACSNGDKQASADTALVRGKLTIVRHGCVACHTIPGVPNPGSHVGPPLERIGRRVYIAGVLANTPENMLLWLRDPPAVDPRTAMPNVGLTEAEARDIATYLATLD